MKKSIIMEAEKVKKNGGKKNLKDKKD